MKRLMKIKGIVFGLDNIINIKPDITNFKDRVWINYINGDSVFIEVNTAEEANEIIDSIMDAANYDEEFEELKADFYEATDSATWWRNRYYAVINNAKSNETLTVEKNTTEEESQRKVIAYEIGRFKLVKTCEACPEQYDVYEDDKQVGYLRLRHGSFAAYYPDYNGRCVYDASTKGYGSFDNDERMEHLTNAVEAIAEAMFNERHGEDDLTIVDYE